MVQLHQPGAPGQRHRPLSGGSGFRPTARGGKPSARFRAIAVRAAPRTGSAQRSEEHTSELQSLAYLVCRLLLEKKKKQARCPTDETYISLTSATSPT